MGVFQPRSGKLIPGGPPLDGEVVFRVNDSSDLPYLDRSDPKYLEIKAVIQEGIEKNKIPSQMIAALSKRLGDDAVDDEAMAIIRTEFNRSAQESHYAANLRIASEFPELKLNHVWELGPSGCCEYCRRLEGQKQAVGTLFSDSASGKNYLFPPVHLGCDCSLRTWRQGWDKFEGI
jgi:hypothetical protein